MAYFDDFLNLLNSEESLVDLADVDPLGEDEADLASIKALSDTFSTIKASGEAVRGGTTSAANELNKSILVPGNLSIN